MGTIETEISSLTNEELAEKLRSIGETFGPITPTTRSQYERKLRRRLVLQNAASCTIAYNLPPSNCETAVETVSPAHIAETKKTDSNSEANDGNSRRQFYGVWMPPNAPQTGQCVFTRVEDALKRSKEIPGSRFNKFSSRSEAEAFCRAENEHSKNTTKVELSRPVPSESSPFKAPRLQELTILRKAVESGDVNTVHSLIWSNPRYLIGSGDNPTILQEGFRYNALHVCARTNQAEAAKLLLDTIESPDFMRLMYPDDSEESRWSRINNLSDMYINTPDKGINDTPLHFACKFGSLAVVSLLVKHPKTNLHVANMHNETPRDVVCSRLNKPSSELKRKFYQMLESQYYVPLLRSDDNSCPAKVAQPLCLHEMSITERNDVLSPLGSYDDRMLMPDRSFSSPIDSPLSVRAFAGPMSRLEAKQFRQKWTMSSGGLSPNVFGRYAHIRRSDINKGLERIGRDLAKEMKVSWCEYWDFLNSTVDLATEQGLKELENHLTSTKEAVMLEIAQRGKRELEMKNDLEICDMFDQLHLFDSSNNICKSSGLDLSNRDSNASAPMSGRGDRLPERGQNGDLGELAGDAEWDRESECSFYTAVDDLDLEYSDCSELFEETMTETVVHVFMMGAQPSKTDADVLRAVENTCVDLEKFPLLHQWYKSVTSYAEDERNRWKAPFSHQHHQMHSTPVQQQFSSPGHRRLCRSDEDKEEKDLISSPIDHSPSSPPPRHFALRDRSICVDLFSIGSLT